MTAVIQAPMSSRQTGPTCEREHRGVIDRRNSKNTTSSASTSMLARNVASAPLNRVSSSFNDPDIRGRHPRPVTFDEKFRHEPASNAANAPGMSTDIRVGSSRS